MPLFATFLLAAIPGHADAQGTVEAWGDNAYGQIGDGTMNQRRSPVAVSALGSGVTAVSAGAGSSFAVLGGAVYAWGSDAYGELGNGTTTDQSTPVAANVLTGGVTAISGGGSHVLAIRNGALYAWGDNRFGQLGDGTMTESDSPEANTLFTSGVSAVSGGYLNSLIIHNGAAYACGYNVYGQLGNGTTDQSTSFVPVTTLTNGVTAVSCGKYHVLAIRNGALYSWGQNDYGELGDGTTTRRSTPFATSLNSGVSSVAASDENSLAVQNGRVFAWGIGPLGDGTTNNSSTPVQIDPADLHDIVAVASNEGASFALSSDGSLWVWGGNSNGEAGLGTATPVLTPQHLLPPAGYAFAAISAQSNGSHAVVLLSPTFFKGEAALGNGAYYLAFSSGNYFGYYSFLSDPRYIYHFDLGYEYVFNANDGKSGVYFYDFKSGGFLYTSPTFPFPYLYDFSLNTVLYYYPNPSEAGHYNTNGVRYFYRFDTGQIITK